MPIIRLQTEINAPIERCFDLSRSIDLHLVSTRQTNETAIAGKTSGLIGLSETVTWRARHYFVWQTLTTQVTELESPYFFADEMVKGAFKSFRHEHHFAQSGDVTLMRDVFIFESPFGILGRLFNSLTLTAYMTKLLQKRNEVIKEVAELDKQVIQYRFVRGARHCVSTSITCHCEERSNRKEKSSPFCSVRLLRSSQ